MVCKEIFSSYEFRQGKPTCVEGGSNSLLEGICKGVWRRREPKWITFVWKKVLQGQFQNVARHYFFRWCFGLQVQDYNFLNLPSQFYFNLCTSPVDIMLIYISFSQVQVYEYTKYIKSEYLCKLEQANLTFVIVELIAMLINSFLPHTFAVGITTQLETSVVQDDM